MTRYALRIPAIVLAVAALAVGARGVGAETREPVNPDRPGATTSAEPVPRGVWQVETGLEYARESNARERTRTFSGVVTVRFGILDGVELRIDGEPFVLLRGDEHATDFGDTAVSAKLRLLEGQESTARPTLSVLPAVKLPTAPQPIGSRRLDAAILGLATWELGFVALELNAGMAAIGQPDSDSYRLQALVAAGAEIEITPTVHVLGDVFYNSPGEREGRHCLGMSIGGIVLMTPDVALDAGVQTTLSGRGPDYVVQAGISLRF